MANATLTVSDTLCGGNFSTNLTASAIYSDFFNYPSVNQCLDKQTQAVVVSTAAVAAAIPSPPPPGATPSPGATPAPTILPATPSVTPDGPVVPNTQPAPVASSSSSPSANPTSSPRSSPSSSPGTSSATAAAGATNPTTSSASSPPAATTPGATQSPASGMIYSVSFLCLQGLHVQLAVVCAYFLCMPCMLHKLDHMSICSRIPTPFTRTPH